jgi:inner membrane protein
MDSATQFVLGAGVGLALLGRRIGPRKAALTGGLLATLPDLDVFIPYEDPIESFIQHRGPTHSLIIQALVTPLFGEALLRLFKGLRDKRILTYLAIYLCFATHALLDALTIYGTKLFWPIWNEPLGTGSVFIIDPLYTLPLLIVTVWALCLKSWSPPIRRGVHISLIISTAYLGFGLLAQQIALSRATDALARHGVVPERLIATATPFNSLLWKAIAIDGDRYLNLYIPLFGGDESITSYVHSRGSDPSGCMDDRNSLGKLARFTKGFYRVDRVGGEVIVSDLRMGMTPEYVFQFAIASQGALGLEAIFPRRLGGTSRGGREDVDWLFANLSGDYALRPAEAGTTLASLDSWRITGTPGETASC